ncbi:ATP-grasp fold amidoligase family protein [Vagococcus sp.]|uniref:ATP-grasp fold amidoligase family protein n=1 Tax=Vagococcus sp. TaxID=1933889 RepID=UPI002FC8A0D7
MFFLNGKPEMIQVNHWVGEEQINYTGHRNTIRTFTNIEGRIRCILPDENVTNIPFSEGEYIELPKDIDAMLDYGSKIAQDFPFVRIDYFYASEKLYLGELTFTPGSGFEVLNDELQIELGSILNLPKER